MREEALRYRCAVLDDYQNVALNSADWSSLAGDVDITVFNEPFRNDEEAKRALTPFHIISAMRERTPFRRELIEALPNLKLLITTGARNASFDLAAAGERGVVVCGTGGYGNSTVGIVFGLMLELTRRIGFENARLKDGASWQTTVGSDLEGLTLGVVGLGKLGRRVATIAQAFGMKVIAWSQNLTAEDCRAAGVEYATKESLFRTADIVTVHVVLSPRSRGLIGAGELALMKPTAYLVNTARGPIVDEQALLAALSEHRIAGAGLDVFATEPLPLDHPLRKLGNAVLTPHLGYVTAQNYARYFADTVEDIRAFLDGRPMRVIAPA
jgi:phosphoglycerate dehydrogenase-like enzyme